jgi:alpha-galactosidase/6-phospho-beta-glucosidase family protein
MPSGEMVAPLIDSFLRDKERVLPLNLPNIDQAPDLPRDVVVESMCIADASGLRGRAPIAAPEPVREWLRRVVSSQEATVEAAIAGDRDKAVEAMLLDPLAGRIDFDHIEQMTDEMLAATAPWLPQFALTSKTSKSRSSTRSMRWPRRPPTQPRVRSSTPSRRAARPT